MKALLILTALTVTSLSYSPLMAQTGDTASTHYYIDIHHIGPGKVTYEAVAQAHAKDLATEGQFGVNFVKYWVDTAGGNVYCLSSSPSPEAIRETHAKAHGLLPDTIFEVTSGVQAPAIAGRHFYLDVHEFGPGKVTAAAVAAAHEKDLAAEKKYGVNFISYWVDEKKGVVMCLSQAADSADVIQTHRVAHGLLPQYIVEVKPGN